MQIDETILELGTAPISADAPGGSSARYEPEFETLDAEIAKLEALNGAPVEWGVVVDAGATILREKSKDILVASYLCHGLLETRGYAGLAAGLAALSAMVSSHWEVLFPEAKRARARGAAVGWLMERAGRSLERIAPGAADQDALAACLETIDALEQALDEKLGDHAPDMGELRRGLRAHAETLAQAAPAPERTPKAAAQPAAQPAAAAAPAPQPAAPPGEIASDQDAQKAIRAAQDQLRAIALYRFGKSLSDPLPYRLVRFATWLNIEEPPPSRDGATEIRAVSAERLKLFDDLAAAGNQAELIVEVETSLSRAPFWLDAHRITATALEDLGHTAARQAVIDGLAGFLRRFPGLVDLGFADGTPFADDDTRLWIRNDVLVEPDAAAAPPTATAGTDMDDAAPIATAAAEARKLARKGAFDQAVALFQDGRRQAQAARERLLWDLELARLCQAAGRADLAVPQLEYLDQQAEHYRLDEWEPDLAVEIMRALFACYMEQGPKNKPTPDRAEKIERLKARIVRLDIGSALAWEKK